VKRRRLCALRHWKVKLQNPADQTGPLDALNMALAMRRPRASSTTPTGAQYTSIEYGHRCREAGVRPSMGSIGDAYDNAMCESFFATLECELLDKRRFKTQAEARIAVLEFIEGLAMPSDFVYPRARRAQPVGRPGDEEGRPVVLVSIRPLRFRAGGRRLGRRFE
jgi:hypothetical protein